MSVATRPVAESTARRGRLAAGVGPLVVLLVLVCIASITMGSRSITVLTIWDAFTNYDPSSAAQTVVREMRVPRTLLGLTAGAALGLSGAILQGLTRNPLAEPGIMGINSGAAAFIVFGIMVIGAQQLSVYLWLGFLGAAVATVMVYAVASFGREGATPVKLALAGAAVTAGFYSLTNAILMSNLEALNELRFWQVGSLAGRYMPVFWQTLPFIAVGLVVALASGRALNGLALGEDIAVALGQRVRLTRLVLFATVAVLCGAATAACGPIVFVGLDGSAPRPAHLRARLSLDPGLFARADADRPPGGRRRRADDRVAERAAGRCRARRPRRTRLHRAGSAPEPGDAVNALVLEAPPIRSGRRSRRRQGVVVTTTLGALAFTLFVVTMMVGSYVLTPWDVVASAFHLSNDPAVDFVVRELRLPVAVTAVAVGLALGLSGHVFQTLLSNQLASPDFVGVSSGSSLFAISAIILFGVSGLAVSGAALLGALTSAALIYVLAWRQGISGYRFILIGIGISQLMSSIVGYVIAHSEIYEAREAMTWLVGSIGQAGPAELGALLVSLAILVPVVLVLQRPLQALELGDDAAKALGARVEAEPTGAPGGVDCVDRVRDRRGGTDHVRRAHRRADRAPSVRLRARRPARRRPRRSRPRAGIRPGGAARPAGRPADRRHHRRRGGAVLDLAARHHQQGRTRRMTGHDLRAQRTSRSATTAPTSFASWTSRSPMARSR